MNFTIRGRSNKKEYDGPAATASASIISGVSEDPFLAAYHKQKMEMLEQPHTVSSSSNSNSRRSSGRKKSSSGVHSPTARRHEQQSRSSSSRRQASSPSDIQSQQLQHQPLASGISSMRTSRRFKDHLPAYMMHPINNSRNGISSTTSRRDKQRSTSSSCGDTSYYSTSHATTSCYTSSSIPPSQYQQKNQSIPIPPEHDGGILCLEPIPTPTTAISIKSGKYRQGYDDGITHRFLSGGAGEKYCELMDL